MSITATLIVQMIVFMLLVWFCMRFIWPPVVKALDERAAKVADGLAAADKAKQAAAEHEATLKAQMEQAGADNAVRLANAERQAQQIVEEAKSKAADEGRKIVQSAQAETEQQVNQAREALREQVAALAVKGAEQILQKEVDANAHAELLNRLKAEL